MNARLKVFLEKWWLLPVMLFFLAAYWNIARINEERVDYVNNGFFTFWLGGQMTWTPEHPYDEQDWVAGHHLNGAEWIPNKIFPYPLPLTLFTAPLGLLPIEQAYLFWDFIAQALIALVVLWMAWHWESLNQRLYVVFVLLAVMLNGNVYLGLMTGTIIALLLVFLALALFFMEKDRPFLGGMALALLALKPPLLTIVLLLGIWLLFRRQWRAISGVVVGGVVLLLVGLIQDPLWVQKFLGAGNNLLSMRVGNQPTIVSYTRLACGGGMDCALPVYGLVFLLLLAGFAWVVWNWRGQLAPIQVFGLAISLGVLLPPYIWSYDYALLVIPVCYTAFELVRRRENYLFATLFLLGLDILSMAGLILFWMNPESQSLTIQRDMWSIWTGLYVLVVTWGVALRPAAAPQIVETAG